MPARFGRLEWVQGRKSGGDLYDLFGIRSEKKGRPQQVFCCRAGDETGGTGSGGVKERCRSTVSLLVLAGGRWVPARVGYWDKATRGGQLEGNDLWDPQGMWTRQGRLARVFCCRAGDKTGDWLWRIRELWDIFLKQLIIWLHVDNEIWTVCKNCSWYCEKYLVFSYKN